MSRTCVTITFRKGGEETFTRVLSGMVAHGAAVVQHINQANETITKVFPLDVVWSMETFELPERGH